MASILRCETCQENVTLDAKFCFRCGEELPTEVLQLKYYSSQGYEYNVILEFLSRFHGVTMSLRTLKNRLKLLGLKRRTTNFDEGQIRRRIQQEIDGPGCMAGYRSMWHTLRCEGYMVPRNRVESILRELDPEGCEERRGHRLKRRAYINPGPNFCWHGDGYDKLKPFGFPIHGCIDGFSRKMIWLKLLRSNNNPEVILKLYLEAVREAGGCPRKVRTNCGTENGLLAAAQSWFTNDTGSHMYGTSQHNQRIEGWWSFFKRSRMTWWINFFKDLVERSVCTTENQIEMECLWFSFASLIQQDLDYVKDHWNSHYIRGSRHETISGRPNELFYLPEIHSAQNYLQTVNENQCQQIEENHNIEEEINEFQEYFIYVMDQCNLSHPQNWREALDLYNHILSHANSP